MKHNLRGKQIKIKVVGYYSFITKQFYKTKSLMIEAQDSINKIKDYSIKKAFLQSIVLESKLLSAKRQLKSLGYSFTRYTNVLKAKLHLRLHAISLNSYTRTFIY